MGWKFWQNKELAAEERSPKTKLQGPKDITQQIGMYLVTVKKMDPDLVWTFKMVSRAKEENPARFDFRLFDPHKSDEAGVRVANFDTLENHAELITYHGWFDKKTQKFEIEIG